MIKLSKFIALLMVLLISGFAYCEPALKPTAELAIPQRMEEKKFEFQMNGSWLPAIPELHVGASNFTDIINMKPLESGWTTVEGFDVLNTTATETPLNLHQFAKNDESHLIAKIEDSGSYYLYDNTTAIPGDGDFSTSELATVAGGHGYFADGPLGAMFYADSENTKVWGGDEMLPAFVFLSGAAAATSGRDYTLYAENDNTDDYFSFSKTASYEYLFIGSPLKLDGIKLYVKTANTTTSTIAGAVWSSDFFDSLTISDGTTASGVALAQTGEITWTFDADAPTIRYLNGVALYIYRFTLSAGAGDIYKVSVSAPFQNVSDVWNGSPRVCTSFQVYRVSAYEDYTYQVLDYDSVADSNYSAYIGGLTTTDHIIVMSDDRLTGIDFMIFADKVNAAADSYIDDIEYWNGTSYSSVSYVRDTTRTTNTSFSKSGVVWWDAPAFNREFPQELFGKRGYTYRITFAGTMTDDADHSAVSVDYASGITAPIEITGYEVVGEYNGRIMLIDGSRVDYSQTDTPWVFNGIDSSNNREFSLYFGDDNPIIATASLYNRYGSNLIEIWLALKKKASYFLTGVQPHSQYSEPFIIRSIDDNIGCAAPMTLNTWQMDVGEGLRMGVAVWLSYSGPIAFFGAAPIKVTGIENFFDRNSDDCINFDYIDKSIGYIDPANDQWNLLIPTGSSTTIDTWLAYDFRYKKWFEKDPSIITPVDWDDSGEHVAWDDPEDVIYWVTGGATGNFPQVVTNVSDTNGAVYNYGITQDGDLVRLDYGQTWNGTPIYSLLKTGAFSPPFTDTLGLWTYSCLRGTRVINRAIDEPATMTAYAFADNTVVGSVLNLALDSTGIITKNMKGGHNLHGKGNVFQFAFSATTSEDKWTPLSWGYKARLIRED